LKPSDILSQIQGAEMQRPSIDDSIFKLAMAGEQAGFTVEQMIQLLNAGLSIEGLLTLIGWKLNLPVALGDQPSPHRWVM
jgi:hypothetical protein